MCWALDPGYFNFPKDSRSVESAQQVGTPRTSFVDPLRKAQNQVIPSIGRSVRIHTAPDAAVESRGAT